MLGSFKFSDHQAFPLFPEPCSEPDGVLLLTLSKSQTVTALILEKEQWRLEIEHVGMKESEVTSWALIYNSTSPVTSIMDLKVRLHRFPGREVLKATDLYMGGSRDSVKIPELVSNETNHNPNSSAFLLILV